MRPLKSPRLVVPIKLTDGNSEMQCKRFREEWIVTVLKSHESQVPLANLARENSVGESRICTRKVGYGGMEARGTKRLHELEAENKKLVMS